MRAPLDLRGRGSITNRAARLASFVSGILANRRVRAVFARWVSIGSCGAVAAAVVLVVVFAGRGAVSTMLGWPAWLCAAGPVLCWLPIARAGRRRWRGTAWMSSLTIIPPALV